MKKTWVMAVFSALISGQAAAQSWVLTSAEDGVEKGNWKISSEALKVKDKTFSIEQKVLHGGKQEGSKVVIIRSEDGLTITLSPTRGMNLLRAKALARKWDGIPRSKEVINPAFINLESRNGLGWLEGFNEMMVRCGYEWTGHPVTDAGQIYSCTAKRAIRRPRGLRLRSRIRRRMKFVFAA